MLAEDPDSGKIEMDMSPESVPQDTSTNQAACPWCGSKSTERSLEYLEVGLSTRHCMKCGVFYPNPNQHRIDYTKYNEGKDIQIEKDSLDIKYQNQEQSRYLFERLRPIIDGFGRDSKPISVLDIGCGSGDLLDQIQKRFSNAHLTGIDPSIHNVRRAWEQHRLEIRQGFWPASSLADRSYDLIVMFGNLMLHEDPRSSLKAAAQLLRPGGMLVFDVKNPHSTTRKMLRLVKPIFPDTSFTRRLYRQAFHGMPWGFPKPVIKDVLHSLGLELVTNRQLPGRNIAIGKRRSLRMLVSNLFDRMTHSLAWLEFVAQRPTYDDEITDNSRSAKST